MRLILVLMAVLLISACTQTVEQVKNEEHVGEQVAVRGEVKSTIKIGSISGYTLEDKNGDTIGVSTDELPKEGSSVVARGVLIKDTIFGYYIKQR